MKKHLPHPPAQAPVRSTAERPASKGRKDNYLPDHRPVSAVAQLMRSDAAQPAQLTRKKESKHDRKDRRLAKASGQHYDIAERISPRRIARDVAEQHPSVPNLPKYYDFRNPKQEEWERRLENLRKAVAAALVREDGEGAAAAIASLEKALATHAKEIHSVDLRVFSNFANRARLDVAKLGAHPPSSFVREGKKHISSAITEAHQDDAPLPDVLTSPVHEIAARNATSSFIVYHHEIQPEGERPTGLTAMTGTVPKRGFRAREWDQHKADYETVEATSLEALQVAVAAKLEETADGGYDFLAVKTDGKYQLRFLQHGDPGLVGHGSMVESDEEDRVAGNAGDRVEVLFAGQFTMGVHGLEKWDNNSGHFRPATAAAGVAPLPLGKYRSGHIDMFKEASAYLAAPIITWLAKKVKLAQADIEALVGGREKITDYQIVDSRDFSQQRKKAAALAALEKKGALLAELKDKRAEIIAEFMTGAPDPDRHDIDRLNASFDKFASELLDKIVANVKAAES